MLSEIKVTDKIEILEDGVIQVREENRIMKDGEKIAGSFHRYCVAPGESAPEGADQKVLDAITTFHTPEVIAAYQASIAFPE